MQVKPLNTISTDALIDCLLIAFANYFVEMPTDKNYYKNRWKVAKVDYSLSFGMFDEDKLVGFIVHAIDKRDNKHIAFNTGTGVIPEYRGQKIVSQIYDKALFILKQNNINHTILEVIDKNIAAVKAYEKVGFNICKNYKCFRGEILIANPLNFTLKKVEYSDFNWKNLPNQNLNSWDNHYTVINNGNYNYYKVFNNDELESYFVINPESGYTPQLDVIKPSEHAWERLFSAIQSIKTSIRIINIDDRLTEKINALKNAGLDNYINQFEMEMVV